MALPVLRSPDGRVTRVITSQDELEKYEADGYKRVRSAAEKAAAEKAAADAAAAKKS